MNPTASMKAVKNDVEIENEKRAHIKDGVAMTKFIYWLKKNTGRIPMDEISVSDYLGKLRMDQEGCIGLSFATISAYGAHGAMCHYSATPESSIPLEPRGCTSLIPAASIMKDHRHYQNHCHGACD